MPAAPPGEATLASSSHPYRGARAALLTQHGKERVVGPVLADALALELVVVADFDTDALGTFTREVPRFGTQLEAARKKATLACERGGRALGLGSEGSFGPGPLGFGVWDLELLVLVDLERDLEIVGRAFSPGLHHHADVASLHELRAVAARARFPEHGLVLRPDGEDDPRVRKGLRTWPDVEAAFRDALGEARSGRVFVENDLRAHQHPRRMATIERATRELVERVASCCPACERPGFGRVSVVAGLPCGDCGAPTDVPMAYELGCVKCEHVERRMRHGTSHAKAAQCGLCNP